MWIQQFQVFIKADQGFVLVPDAEYYDTQKTAFAWIDEKGDKEAEYVILPVITYDNEATY